MTKLWRGAPAWSWALAGLCLLVPFYELGLPVMEVDDARYAEVPREMVASGDWATPRLNDMEYVEKPPLWYWLAAASYSVFGVGEAAARLPLALLSVSGVLLTFWLARFLYDARVAAASAASLGSGALYFFLSHYMTLDLLLTVTLLAETALILRCLVKPADARWAAPAAWLAAALAFLSKGLVALVLPGAWAVAVFVLVPAWRRAFIGLLNPWGMALFAVVAAPWFLLMEDRHPGFLRFFFGEQHFERFLTPKYNRQNPWWFFPLLLPIVMLPWTPAVAAAVARPPRRWLEAPADLALALWALVLTAFFSASQSKLLTYILPVAPHLSILAARGLERGLPVWSRKLSVGLGLLLGVAALLAPFAPKVPPEALPWGPVVAGSLAAGLIVGGRTASTAMRAAAFCLGGLAAGLSTLAAARANVDSLSVRGIAQVIAAQARAEDEVWTYDVYLHGLPFYLRRRVDRIVNWVGELHYARRWPEHEDRFGNDSAVRYLPWGDHRTFIVLPVKQARHLIALTTPGAIIEHGRYGRWELVVIGGRKELPHVKPPTRPALDGGSIPWAR